MNKFLTTEALYELFIECNQKITTDTRKIEIDSLFFSLKGENFDANEFAEKAIEQGCKYAIVDNESVANNQSILLVEDVLKSLQKLANYHRKQLNIPIIGITGSNGKTTNKELINAVLSKKYNTYATKGNLNNHIGVPLTLLSFNKTHEIGIIEMGANHQGEINLLCEIADPDYGLITNIGKAHLEGFGGIEGVKKGKSELYKYLLQKNGKIFINGNDSILDELSKKLLKIYYGENSKFDIHGKLYDENEYVEFKWNVKNQSLENRLIVKTHMFGHYNFINLLCAVCIGNYFQVLEEDINTALENYIPEMNRSQVVKTKCNTVILDAYNANPSSMYLAIDNFTKQKLENKIAILGDMLELGEYSENEHQKIILQVENTNINTAYFIGEIFYKFKDNYKKYCFFKSVIDFKSFLETNKINNSTILIKGSRGIQLEKIVELL